jgi:hypothetical protein
MDSNRLQIQESGGGGNGGGCSAIIDGLCRTVTSASVRRSRCVVGVCAASAHRGTGCTLRVVGALLPVRGSYS